MTQSSSNIPPHLRDFFIELMQKIAAGDASVIESLKTVVERTAEVSGFPFSIGVLTTLAKEEITGKRFDTLHKDLCRDNPDLTIGVIGAMLAGTIETRNGEVVTSAVVLREIDARIADTSHRPSFDAAKVEQAYKAQLRQHSRS